jgi:hypothetical protein
MLARFLVDIPKQAPGWDLPTRFRLNGEKVLGSLDKLAEVY